MLIGCYKVYAQWQFKVEILINFVNYIYLSARNIINSAIGLRLRADESYEAGECLHNERLFYGDIGHTAMVNKNYI